MIEEAMPAAGHPPSCRRAAFDLSTGQSFASNTVVHLRFSDGCIHPVDDESPPAQAFTSLLNDAGYSVSRTRKREASHRGSSSSLTLFF